MPGNESLEIDQCDASVTHNEEKFEYNDKVSLRLGLDDPCRVSPVLHEVVDCQQEEDHVGCLQGEDDAVEVDELRRGKESCPLSPGLVVLLKLFPPRLANEALTGPHVRPSKLARAELVNEPHHQAQHQGHPLGVQRVQEQLEAALLRAGHREHWAELEEDVGRHGVDPERERCEGVECQISDC